VPTAAALLAIRWRSGGPADATALLFTGTGTSLPNPTT
jgi:hypothetical protein